MLRLCIEKNVVSPLWANITGRRGTENVAEETNMETNSSAWAVCFTVQMSPSLPEFAKSWPSDELNDFPTSPSKGKHSHRPDTRQCIISLLKTVCSKTMRSCPLTESLFRNKVLPEWSYPGIGFVSFTVGFYHQRDSSQTSPKVVGFINARSY